MADAARADELTARGGPLGVLHGLPVAHKDLVDTAGIRTTRGSPFYRDNVPDARRADRDAHARRPARSRAARRTRRSSAPDRRRSTRSSARRAIPYDLTKTCGGSSGGAAVALACGMVPIADGSDTGGSLRNPAAFCNVVGLRPSPGRVPSEAASWSPLSVSGPMARSVADVALFLSAIAGPDPRSPLSIAEDGARFRAPLGRDFKGVRVAWWTGLGGIPVRAGDPPRRRRQPPRLRRPRLRRRGGRAGLHRRRRGVSDVCDSSAQLSAVRAARSAQRPEWVKDTIKYEVAQAERSRAPTSAARWRGRRGCTSRAAQFFERYDYFVLPVTQVAPFDVDHAVSDADRTASPMATYIDWMRSCWYVTFMANPAISVPAGFTAGGLPVGLQIVGRHRDDWSVLQLAHAFEQATRHGLRRPALDSRRTRRDTKGTKACIR